MQCNAVQCSAVQPTSTAELDENVTATAAPLIVSSSDLSSSVHVVTLAIVRSLHLTCWLYVTRG